MENILTSSGSNSDTATMDVEEIVDQESLAQREAFRQVLHVRIYSMLVLYRSLVIRTEILCLTISDNQDTPSLFIV